MKVSRVAGFHGALGRPQATDDKQKLARIDVLPSNDYGGWNVAANPTFIDVSGEERLARMLRKFL